jgi:hypothetical protein
MSEFGVARRFVKAANGMPRRAQGISAPIDTHKRAKAVISSLITHLQVKS